MFRKSKTSIYPLKPISFSSCKIIMFNYEILTTKIVALSPMQINNRMLGLMKTMVFLTYQDVLTRMKFASSFISYTHNLWKEKIPFK